MTAKKTNTPTVARLKKEADLWFSKYVRYRDSTLTDDGWWAQCITCNKWFPMSQIQAGHFQSRRFNSTRYDELNVNGQCAGCNVFRYGEQYKYSLAVDEKYGDGTAERLARQAQQLHKLTIDELAEIIHDAKEQVKFYERQAGQHE